MWAVVVLFLKLVVDTQFKDLCSFRFRCPHTRTHTNIRQLPLRLRYEIVAASVAA